MIEHIIAAALVAIGAIGFGCGLLAARYFRDRDRLRLDMARLEKAIGGEL